MTPVEYVVLEFADDGSPDLLLLASHLRSQSEEFAAGKPTFSFQGQRFKRERFESQRVDDSGLQTVLLCVELTD